VPTLTEAPLETRCRCDECGQRKPRKQFSVANGICLECFDRYFQFCENCGAVLHRLASRTHYSGTREIAFTYNGQVICWRCRNNLEAQNRRECWPRKALDTSAATYTRLGSGRKYGVEIETASCNRYEDLHGHTNFGCKDDCSISGMEFDSPVLYGDEGLDYIVNFLNFAADNDWTVDEDCGCHTHYDMRDENYHQLCSTAYAYRKTIALWEALVPSWRHHHSYSHAPGWTCSDFKQVATNSNFRGIAAADDFDRFNEFVDYFDCDRYEFVNLRAYGQYRTFEVRILEGTCDASVICNWITVHCRFIDAVKDMSFDEIDDFFGRTRSTNFDGLAKLIDDEDIEAWLKQRARTNR